MDEVKHFFIINPKAGKLDISKKIVKEIEESFKDNNEKFTIYITKDKNDATNYSKEVCEIEQGILKFYACGGDGTLNEVVNGIVGYSNAFVSVIPYGTGNDFVNNFTYHKDFFNIKEIINFNNEKIDLLKINNKYSVNLCNIGFDAKVARNISKFKRFPLISGQGTYTLSVFYTLLHKMHSNLEITIDNLEVLKGDFLLCIAANGMTYGGGYKGAPLAEVNDGLMDICIFKKVSRFKLLKLINIYKRGEHLENEEMKEYFIYRKCKTINIKSKEDLTVCIDGQIIIDKEINISIDNKAISFLIPHKEIIS